MTPIEAAKLLEVAPDATPEQLEARFLELRRKLEDKIAKAPTPGLQAKYRESLAQITTAFETLTLAADSSALPVLTKSVAGGADPGPKTQPPAPGSPPPATTSASSKKKKSNFEFLTVSLIAVAVLGAGGWWVMKTRQENAERAAAQAVAEQKIAADKLAQEQVRVATENTRRETEAREKAEQVEKARLAEVERNQRAEAEKIRQEQLEQLGASARTKLAEIKISWEATEQLARAAERRTSEMRSEARNLTSFSPEGKKLQAELAAQQEFSDWLAGALPRHPARVARAQAEELIASRQYAQALATLKEAQTAQLALDDEIARTRKSLFVLLTSARIEVSPTSATWELVDAYGAIHTGKGNADLADLPFGPARLRAAIDGFEPKETNATLKRGEVATLKVAFQRPKLTLNTIPAGAAVAVNGIARGVTPVVVDLEQPGECKLMLTLAGHFPHSNTVKINEGGNDYAATLISGQTGILGFGYNREPNGAVKITSILAGSPAAAAGMAEQTFLVAIEKQGPLVRTDSLSVWDLVQSLAGEPGTSLKIRVAEQPNGPARELILKRVKYDAIEQARKTAAVVYFIRPARFAAGAMKGYVTVNGTRLILRNSQYAVVRLPAGRVQAELYLSPRAPYRYPLELHAGANYIDCDYADNQIQFRPMDPTAGAAAITKFSEVQPVSE